ncbi:MAG: hypothetical protein ACUVTD_07835 [Nitrososphaerales archaeon]
MPRYIIDASIVAKWILPGEPYEDKAVRLKEDSIERIAELHSPSILTSMLQGSPRALTVGGIATINYLKR